MVVQGILQITSPQRSASADQRAAGMSFERRCRPFATSSAKRTACWWIGGLRSAILRVAWELEVDHERTRFQLELSCGW